jgi:hypothetical protein
VFYHYSPKWEVPGRDPAGRDYVSFARFSDPDGNGWMLGVALSVLPILTRVLPPLVGEALPDGRRSISAVTAGGLVLYVVAVGGLVVVLNR